jgi:2-keto-4-pentenoate hydratase
MFDTEAKALWTARRHGGTVATTDLSAIGTVRDAYAVQRAIGDLEDSPTVGWKLGATAPASIELLGLERSFTGPLYARDIVESGSRYDLRLEQTNLVETELCLQLAHALPARDERYSREDAHAALGVLRAAFEVVTLRFEGGPKGNGHLAIADGGINGGVVLGDEISIEATRDPGFAASLVINGEAKASGGMAATLWDDILDAITWLANQPELCGGGLKAGDLIMAGTMTGLTPVALGDQAMAEFGDGKGVRASF